MLRRRVAELEQALDIAASGQLCPLKPGGGGDAIAIRCCADMPCQRICASEEMPPSTTGASEKPDISRKLLAKWQRIVDLMARTVGVPAGLIMKAVPPEIEVLVRSSTEGNPYTEGERAELKTGLYCETVMEKRAPLLVPDASKDPEWDHNPDIELGMLFYLGYPLHWPDGSVFGTICVLDKRENAKAVSFGELIQEFAEIIQSDLNSILFAAQRDWEMAKLRRVEASLKLNEERLNALLHLSNLRESSEEELVEHALEEGVRLTQSEIGYLHFVAADEKTLQLHTWSNEALKKCTAAKTNHYPVDEAGIWADCVRFRKPVIHNDYQGLAEKKGYPKGHSHVVRHASVPIFDGDKIVAIIGVGNKAAAYNGSDVRQLSLFANSLWDVLTRKRAELQLEESKLHLEECVRERTAELKRTNEILYRSEANLRKAQSIAHMGNYSWDIRTGKMFWCTELKAIVGCPDAAPSFERMFSLIHPDDRELVKELGRLALEEGREFDAEYRVVRPDGHVRYVHDVADVSRDGAGQPVSVFGVLQDITVYKEAEDKIRWMEANLAHVARLSTMGEIAASIAHEVNQPLITILNYAKACTNLLASRELPQMEELREWNKEIAASATHAGEIVRRLRNYGRRGEPSRSSVDIRQIIRDSIQFVVPEARRRHVIFQVDLPEVRLTVSADQVQLQQVLVNLVQNALEAMEDIAPERRKVKIGCTLAEDQVTVSVADAGIGLPPKDDLNLFEAFVTTKSDGLGMGLAISKTIVEAHGGSLAYKSNSQGGATFSFALPVEIHSDSQ
jgi:signal transduction histidine kinase/GAF domain-containing protein